MRVVINPEPLVGARTGIGHYLGELLRCLPPLMGPGDRLDRFPLGFVFAGRDEAVPPGFHEARHAGDGPPGQRSESLLQSVRRFVLAKCRRAHRFLLYRYRRLYRALVKGRYRAGRYDLYHEPNFIPIPSDLPTVTSIHDLSVLLHPEWHPKARVLLFEHNFVRALPRSSHFLAISEAARQEIIRVLGIPADRVSRTYMGVRPHLRPMGRDEIEPARRRLGLPEEYLLHVGTIEPRKNLKMLMRAYCDLPEGLRRRCPLVLAGGWGWNTHEIAEFYETTARRRGVMRLGYLPEADLGAVYNGARALVFPSLYEGFGLPPVEMMACGGAVLASSIGPVAETVGGRAQLLDAADLEGWRGAMARVIVDDDWRASLRDGTVEAARPFTWEQCARDTLRAYHTCLTRAGAAAA